MPVYDKDSRCVAYYVKDSPGIVRRLAGDRLSCTRSGHSNCEHKAAVSQYLKEREQENVRQNVPPSADAGDLEPTSVKLFVDEFNSKSS